MAPKNVPKITSKDVYEFPYFKPEKKKFLDALRESIWNPEEKQFFGRTFRNWGSILFFYAVFFSVLALMFAICMYGMLATIDDHRPTYLLDSSIIGSNPGLGFRPYSKKALEDHSSSLVWYEAKNSTSVTSWTEGLDHFLFPYIGKDHKGSENRVMCSFDHPPPPGKVCDVSISSFNNCTAANGYGFNNSAPCVFIKLNRIFNWIPEYYNDTSHLPVDMNEDLKTHIQSLSPKERNTIWISCYGESPADRENIGPITYSPMQGFPGYFYPFTNTPGYLSPLVAVQFNRPRRHNLINVECRAWANNIKYELERNHRSGSVHFELLVD